MLEIFIKSPVAVTPSNNETTFYVLLWALERIEKPDARRLLIEAAALLACDD